MQKKPKKKWKRIKRRIKFAIIRHAVLPALIPLLKLWAKSLRVRGNLSDFAEKNLNEKQPIVLATLHGNAFCALGVLSNYSNSVSIVTLVSPSRDGELLDYTIRRFGQYTVRGSSSSGGKTALLELRKQVRENRIPLLAVDGPRGPRAQPRGGAIALARSTNAKLVLMVATAKPTIRLNSWDRFMIPLPFARINVHFETFRDYASHSEKKDLSTQRVELQKRILLKLEDLGEDTSDVIKLKAGKE